MNPLTRRQVREIDRFAIEQFGVPGAVLMENAGRNAADAAERLLARMAGRSAAVVAGGGNNGGDGFVIARHLALRGVRVVTFLLAQPDAIAGDARINLDILRALGHDLRDASADPAGLGEQLRAFDLIVDAIGGTGVRGALRGVQAQAVEQINAAGRPVLAVDIPTGLDCDTGQAEGPAVRAVLTVTFVARKVGFDAPGADRYTGEVVVADIGIPAELVAERIARDA
ncbi:MAG TPA: NAD(P)H-hydrate epimerase [Phycisphaerales bacterium]|nr:NAD(P)H-hydrate epimerase [Phycisphaerales bacterium]